ncbi:MAG: hypothetical protein J6C23_07905 [Clostridia bacterium]|nr:hypothetical protein [Clostridia bacterium]
MKTLRILSKEEFAELQQMFVKYVMGEDYNKTQYEEISDKYKANADSLTVEELKKMIYPIIFGLFEVKTDYDKAEKIVRPIFESVKNAEPEDIDSDEYIDWMGDFGQVSLLLGTIYVYKDEFVKAAYHLISALKTDCLTLNLPYCDFIKTALDQLGSIQIEEARYTGVGFDVDHPMGSDGGSYLNAMVAPEVISCMEGVNGEVIIAKRGRSGMFGYLERRGSTMSENVANILDIYETYVVDKEYNIKKMHLYFNGYFNRDNRIKVRLANGFRFKKKNLVSDIFEEIK